MILQERFTLQLFGKILQVPGIGLFVMNVYPILLYNHYDLIYNSIVSNSIELNSNGFNLPVIGFSKPYQQNNKTYSQIFETL